MLPELGGGGERAAVGGDGAHSVLRAGGGLVESFAGQQLGVGSFLVALEDVIGLAAADEGNSEVIMEGGEAVGDGVSDVRHQ